MSKVKPVPEGYPTVTPYLIVRGASEALAFYAKAFGAEETFRMPGPGGAVMHAEMMVGTSPVMLSDENPAMGARSPQDLGGTCASLFLYVEDVDAAFRRATGAGAVSLMEPADMFWGDRMCKVTDPYGHEWALASHVEDVPPEEMQKRMQEFSG
jgi:PhnB protein